MAQRVGLTGGIGSGKSTVAKLFADRGIVVIDADRVARDVILPGSDGLQQIIAHFGDRVIAADGSLDRQALGAIVFADQKQRTWLEALLHPLIRNATDHQAANLETPWCLLEIPLLVETNRHRDMFRTIVVHCPLELRIQRLRESRAMSEEQIQRIADSQASDSDRLAIADHVIDNDGSLDRLPAQVDHIIAGIDAALQT